MRRGSDTPASRRVLIVEDSPDSRETLKLLLGAVRAPGRGGQGRPGRGREGPRLGTRGGGGGHRAWHETYTSSPGVKYSVSTNVAFTLMEVICTCASAHGGEELDIPIPAGRSAA